MSAGPRSEKFNIVSNDHGRTQKVRFLAIQFVKPILQAITHLIQYTVSEIQYLSVKCTAVTVRYAKVSSISIPSHQAMQVIAMVRLYESNPLQNAFKHI